MLVTGHTGFKGGWMSLWLTRLGANVNGFALPPPTGPSLYEAAKIGSRVDTTSAISGFGSRKRRRCTLPA